MNSNTIESTTKPDDFLSIDLSGNDIENKLNYYKELSSQLYIHIQTTIEQTSSIGNNISFSSDLTTAYKELMERYLVAYQKYSKWLEFYTYFCIITNINILGKTTTLQDAINSKKGFENLNLLWKNASYQVSNKRLNERLQHEPTLEEILKQQQQLNAIIDAYEISILEAKIRKININVSKQFFAL